MGIPGPDAGKGGKHLVLPPGTKGPPPAGYHVGQARSFKVLVALRSLPVKGDVKGAIDALRAVKVYPLATAENPKLSTFDVMSIRVGDWKATYLENRAEQLQVWRE